MSAYVEGIRAHAEEREGLLSVEHGEVGCPEVVDVDLDLRVSALTTVPCVEDVDPRFLPLGDGCKEGQEGGAPLVVDELSMAVPDQVFPHLIEGWNEVHETDAERPKVRCCVTRTGEERGCEQYGCRDHVHYLLIGPGGIP